MKVEFRTSRLKKQCADRRSRCRTFGDEPGRRLGRRLTALLAADCLEDLRNGPGRLHELKGDRARQYSLDLHGPYRLIFEAIVDEATPSRPSWSEITHVRILGIEDTHE